MGSRKSEAKRSAAAVASPQRKTEVETIDYGSGPLDPLPAGTAELMDAMDAQDQDEADLTPAAPPRPEPQMISVSLPLGELDPKEYRSAHIDMHLTPEQADTLRELAIGLRGMPFELTADGRDFRNGGRLVDSGQNALRWLLNGLAIAKRRRASEAESSPESTAQESEDSET